LPFQETEKEDKWIQSIIQKEEQTLDAVTFIFCSDEYLHKINMEYLNHDTYTDIITFPMSDIHIESDIFISLDRIRENATQFNLPFEKELHRVMIHGILHLCGYGDKSAEEQQLMTQKENKALKLLEDI
ncbi:MAG: rRNA maturation RNase YbeY, partial [Saprospiraceae bacterium]